MFLNELWGVDYIKGTLSKEKTVICIKLVNFKWAVLVIPKLAQQQMFANTVSKVFHAVIMH